MKLTQALKMAAKSISANKGRSALTMLGVIIGLAAVIILVSYAEGQNAAMQKYYESLGENKLDVYAYCWDGSVDVNDELYNYCQRISEYVAGITPNGQIWSDITISYGVQTLGTNSYSFSGGGIMVGDGVYVISPGVGGGETYVDPPTFYLGNDQFTLCNNYTLARGRDISYMDVERTNQVCVLGASVAQTLFGMIDPIDETVTVNGMPFTVIGVYAPKGNGVTQYNEEGDNWQEVAMSRMDNIVVFPSTLTRVLNNNQSIDEYTVKARDSASAKMAATLIKSFLDGVIGDNGSVDVTNQSVYQEEEADQNKMQQMFLGGIAAISLLVGGVGIMNIMLVTVTERTREIGIRKAIGAERRSIITQFLIEAAMICGIGGILGIAVGYLGTLIVGKLAFKIVLIPGVGITIGAFAISVALGIIFGMYPAAKASRLQPVEALRAD